MQGRVNEDFVRQRDLCRLLLQSGPRRWRPGNDTLALPQNYLLRTAITSISTRAQGAARAATWKALRAGLLG